MKPLCFLFGMIVLLGCDDRVVSLADADAGSPGDTETDSSPIDSETSMDSSSESEVAQNTIDNVLYDLVGEPYNPDIGAPWGAHEELPHGVPAGFSWLNGATTGAWTNPGSPYQCPAFAGMVYESSAESPVTDVRVQVRNAEHWYLQNGEWTLFDSASDSIDGGTALEDMSANPQVAEAQVEPSENGGGISVEMVEGHLYQWWTPTFPRPVAPAEPVDAWFVTAQVRLIAGANPDVDLSHARYLARVGMNWYQYPEHATAQTDTVAGAVFTRFKFLSPEWTHFNLLMAGSDLPTDTQDYTDLVSGFPPIPGVTY